MPCFSVADNYYENNYMDAYLCMCAFICRRRHVGRKKLSGHLIKSMQRMYVYFYEGIDERMESWLTSRLFKCLSILDNSCKPWQKRGQICLYFAVHWKKNILQNWTATWVMPIFDLIICYICWINFFLFLLYFCFAMENILDK